MILIVIEVEPGNAVVTFRMFRFFLDADSFSILIKLHDTEAFRIIHIISKYCCAFTRFRIGDGSSQSFLQSVASENIVAQSHRHRLIPNKLSTKDKCLCLSIRGGLNRIDKVDAKLMTVSQQALKPGVYPAGWR